MVKPRKARMVDGSVHVHIDTARGRVDVDNGSASPITIRGMVFGTGESQVEVVDAESGERLPCVSTEQRGEVSKRVYQPKWSDAPLPLSPHPLPPQRTACRTTIGPYWCEPCKQPRAVEVCPMCGRPTEHVPELGNIEIAGPVLPKASSSPPLPSQGTSELAQRRTRALSDAMRESVLQAVQELSACSPATLDRLGAELDAARARCACQQCDACSAREAVSVLCRSLAVWGRRP